MVCTSCESILEVRNPGLVGQIVACPKCRSMVLIEPTSQTRPLPVQPSQPIQVSQAADASLPDEWPISEPSAPIPVGLATEDTPLTVDTTDSRDDANVGGQFGPVAAELQAEFLNDVVFDPWQKRRLVIVAVGTICLLTTFAVFLCLWVLPNHAPTPELKPGHAVNRNEPPPVPDGVGVSHIGGQPDQPDGTHDATPLPNDSDHQNNATPLPSADEIKVEGQSDPDESLPDTSDAQSSGDQGDMDEFVMESISTGPPRPIPGQPGAAVRVTAPPVESSNDPFDDIDDSIVIPDAPVTEESGNDGSKTNGDPSETMDDPEYDPGGFADMFDDDTLPAIGANEQEITEPGDDSGITTPDINVSPDVMEPEDREPETIKPDEIDIDERLTPAVASIQFEKAAIVDVVRALSDMSGVPMQLDVDEVRARGISVETPMTLQVQETTIAGIIDAVLEKTRLTRHDDNGCLVFGYSDEQITTLRTARYDMSRLATLAQSPISAEQAASWLTELLINPSHNPKAVNAAVAVDGNEIVVVGTTWLHDQARRLLLTLFYLRDLEPESNLTPERLAPEVFGWDRVNTPLSFHLVEPIPLQKAARLIEDHTKLRVLIDHAALHDEGLSQETPVTSRVSHGTIDTVLSGMLEPLGLTYRIMEANAVEITTQQAAREKMTMEAHRYAPLPDGTTPESCAEAMRQTFGGDASWNNTAGMIVIDSASGYMLVRQSQPMQRDIRLRFGQTLDGEDHVIMP